MKKMLLLPIASSSISLMGIKPMFIPPAPDLTQINPDPNPNPNNCCIPYGRGTCLDYVIVSILTPFSIAIDLAMCPTIACYRVAPCPTNDACDKGDNLCNERPSLYYCCLTAKLWAWEESKGCKKILSCCLPSNETRRKIWSSNNDAQPQQLIQSQHQTPPQLKEMK